MKATEWSHLPNAVHIDRVIAAHKSHPDKWDTARRAACNAAWNAACNASRITARIAACNAACDTARIAACNAACNTAWNAACSAILCLIAYDDCAHLLDLEPEEVKVLALLGHKQAILLLPAVIAFHSIAQLNSLEMA